MKLFYVMGGGLGHLYRVYTFIQQTGLTDFAILTNNPLAVKFFLPEEIIPVQGKTQVEVVRSIQSFIRLLKYDELYIDTFPAGLFGELVLPGNRRTIYLARRLKWKTYQSVMKPDHMQLDETIYFEALEPEHEEFVRAVSARLSGFILHYPVPHPERVPVHLLPKEKPLWLIVHSFDKEEVLYLLQYAQDIARIEKQEPAFIVLSDQPLDHPEVYFWFPACDWFPLADRIFTGGGFNVLQQTASFIQKITAIPFPRQYDDQAWRIQQLAKQAIH